MAEKLQILAKEIHKREEDAIGNLQSISERERPEYLRDCKESYEATLALLESGEKLRHEFQSNNVKAPIAGEIFSFLEKGVNIALQSVRNYKIRMIYITKIKDHAGDMMRRLRTLDGANAAAASATAFKNFMSEFHAMKQVTLSQNQNITKKLHRTGMTFQSLLNGYQRKFQELQGRPFRDLSANQQIKVYASIINDASGQESPFENLIKMVLGHAGTAFLLFMAGIIVWDIFSSESRMENAVSNIIQAAEPVGGAVLRQALGVADAKMPTDLDLCAVMAGIVTGRVRGDFADVVLGTFVSGFVETFITSGGSTEIVGIDNRYYVIQTPNGVALAGEIAPPNL